MAPSAGKNRRPKLPATLQLGRSGVHGYGVFARDFIPQEERIIEYVGERITKREAERREAARLARRAAGEDGCVYVFEMTKRYDIDGDVPWNPARHINHSCAPNCDAVVEDGRIWIETIEDVAPGEELAYDYAYVLEERHSPAAKRLYPCHCGAAGCRGTILAKKR